MVMRCCDCKREIPLTPKFFVGKRGPLCVDDFWKRRKRGRRSLWRRFKAWVRS